MKGPSNSGTRGVVRPVASDHRENLRLAARARELRIPELYRRPMGDRDLQGCLKARA